MYVRKQCVPGSLFHKSLGSRLMIYIIAACRNLQENLYHLDVELRLLSYNPNIYNIHATPTQARKVKVKVQQHANVL